MTETGKSGSEPATGPSPRPAWLPAAAGLLVVVGIAVAWKLRSDGGGGEVRPSPSAASGAPSPSGATGPTARPKPPGAPSGSLAPTPTHDHLDEAESGGDIKPYPVENIPPSGPPALLTEEDIARQKAEDEAARKPPLEVQDKIEKARASLPNLEAAATQLERQADEAARAGRSAEAQEKRVRVRRMRERIAKIRAAVESGTDPSGPVDEL